MPGSRRSDPTTELPPPVTVGFLRRKDGTGRGQGHVSYVIRPRSGLATGTAIRNVAQIVFDGQLAIATNQVDPHDASKGTDPAKEALVTIDADSPASAMTTLPTKSPRCNSPCSGRVPMRVRVLPATTFMWSTNKRRLGPSGSTSTPATRHVQRRNGKSYQFFVVARDGAGLSSPLPTASTPAQTSTSVPAAEFTAAPRSPSAVSPPPTTAPRKVPRPSPRRAASQSTSPMTAAPPPRPTPAATPSSAPSAPPTTRAAPPAPLPSPRRR